ncbi:hypothetical protein F5Y03DRAFT_404158 [Xylaria venustula]|nr:hypothetical protein F5Y03DRAFT_404158 [Xylaria venustula]
MKLPALVLAASVRSFIAVAMPLHEMSTVAAVNSSSRILVNTTGQNMSLANQSLQPNIENMDEGECLDGEEGCVVEYDEVSAQKLDRCTQCKLACNSWWMLAPMCEATVCIRGGEGPCHQSDNFHTVNQTSTIAAANSSSLDLVNATSQAMALANYSLEPYIESTDGEKCLDGEEGCIVAERLDPCNDAVEVEGRPALVEQSRTAEPGGRELAWRKATFGVAVATLVLVAAGLAVLVWFVVFYANHMY